MKAKTDQEACDLLDRLVIASPCSIPWESMTGDNRQRLCGGCSRFVHNISDMSKREAGEFLQANGTSHCMIFYRRFDGTIMTDDCPVGLRKIRNACRFAYRVAASLFVMLLSIPGALAQQNQQAKQDQNHQEQQTKEPQAKQDQQAKPDQQVKPAQARLMNRFGALVGPDWKEPTPPPGFQYTGNPAGGGMILQPITKGNSPIAVPGQAIAIPADKPNPVRVKPDCNTPALIIKQPQTLKPGVVRNHPVKPPVVTTVIEPVSPPQGNENLDSTAQMYYEKGRAAASTGKKSLAGFYYEKALAAFDNQKAGDPRFRLELERAISSLKE